MNDWLPLKPTEKQKTQLKQLGIFSFIELLNYFPVRYEHIIETDLSQAEVGDKIAFSGILVSEINSFYYHNKKRTTFRIENQGNIYSVVSFNPYLGNNQKWLNEPGKEFSFFGIKQEKGQLNITRINPLPIKELVGLNPIYKLSENIKNWQVTALVKKALKMDYFPDDLPEYLVKKHNLLSLADAYKTIHLPKNELSLDNAKKRLKYQELFFFNLHLLNLKQKRKSLKKAKIFDEKKITAFIENLPFELNQGQKEAINDILVDLKSEYTMFRLLQGEVGSGKTIVATVAMYACVLTNLQAVMLAPTDLLAKQHYQSLTRFLPTANIILLSSSMDKDKLTESLKRVSLEDGLIIIGTHRVFQDDVVYKNLGLVIADEQQRFGVNQRQKLSDKGVNIDVLQMSATPIPRTIALSLYADMDVSILTDSIYPRNNIKSSFINVNSFFKQKEEIENLLSQGNLAFVVCASIAGVNSSAKNVEELAKSLSEYYQGRFSIGTIHSQMKEEIQDKVMADFINHKIQILICTSIIEVGIDVKDANIIIIYDADRFGLSQLHQLRGRIGRFHKEAYCYFLSDSKDENAIKRLNFLASTYDGMKIAKYDFYRRGFGDIVGVRQSGKPLLQLIDIEKDEELLKQILMDARNYLKKATNDDPLLLKYEDAGIIKD